MGDQLLAYSKAKWLAYKYKLPFYLTPFDYADQFTLSGCEKVLREQDKKKFKEIVNVGSAMFSACLNKAEQSTLFKVGFGSDLSMYELYLFSRQNKQFEIEIKRLLQPLSQNTFQKIDMPSNVTTVAVHVRKGSGPDGALTAEQYFNEPELQIHYFLTYLGIGGKNEPKVSYSDKDLPGLFPPEQYYVDQLIQLSELLFDVPLYVYIFTDDSAPQALVQRFEKKLNKKNILFATSPEKRTKMSLLDELYAMARFDCLIKSSSHFSFIAQLIGTHKIIFSVRHAGWISEKRLFVDQVDMFLKEPRLNDPKRKFFNSVFAPYRSRGNYNMSA